MSEGNWGADMEGEGQSAGTRIVTRGVEGNSSDAGSGSRGTSGVGEVFGGCGIKDAE